jgi:hypothetical protein
MATEAQRKALEQLMGSDTTTYSRRPTTGNNPNYLTTFTDSRLCRPYLVGHCPHDLFENTKFEQGPCKNQHNGRLRQMYQDDPERESYGYEWDYAKVLRGYIEECDKRIESSQRRLETTYEEMVRQRQLMKEIGELATKITFSLDEIQVLGNQSQVAMALQQFHNVDLMRHDKQEKEVGFPPYSPFCSWNWANGSKRFARIVIRRGVNQSYKCVTSVEHISPVLTMTDVSQIISQERYNPDPNPPLSPVFSITPPPLF